MQKPGGAPREMGAIPVLAIWFLADFLDRFPDVYSMKKPQFDPAWPDSWKLSYKYDLEEVFGEFTNYGYVYAYARRMAETLAMVREVASPPAAILDVAAGAGNFSLRDRKSVV